MPTAFHPLLLLLLLLLARLVSFFFFFFFAARWQQGRCNNGASSQYSQKLCRDLHQSKSSYCPYQVIKRPHS